MDATEAKILIVDNDEHVLIALERELENEGYRTVTAWSGQEALELLRETKFDLLLVGEHLSDLSTVDWFGDLQHAQHHAYRLLMCPLRAPADPAEDLRRRGIHASVCKWEHSAIKEKIRGYLPG